MSECAVKHPYQSVNYIAPEEHLPVGMSHWTVHSEGRVEHLQISSMPKKTWQVHLDGYICINKLYHWYFQQQKWEGFTVFFFLSGRKHSCQTGRQK